MNDVLNTVEYFEKIMNEFFFKFKFKVYKNVLTDSERKVCREFKNI